MNIVLLAAGTSSRMGKENKMLIPYKSCTLVAHCALTALKSLSLKDEKSRLIVVSGYKHKSLLKALEPCKTYIEQTDGQLEMIVVQNVNYRNGQFTSAKTGVKEVPDREPFFISLADMPLIKKENYHYLINYLQDYDAVRPVCDDIPGHPVYFSEKMKKLILSYPDNASVGNILKRVKTRNLQVEGSSWIYDIDCPEDLSV